MVIWNRARTLPERIGNQPFCTERLQIVACPQAEREMIVNANCVLRKSGILVCVRVSDRRAEALKIIMRHLVGVGTQRRRFQAAFDRLKSERIHFDWVENVLPAEQRWKVVVDFQVSSASPPNFQEWRLPSKLMVSAKWARCSRVCRGRMDDRPKTSMIVGMRVLGSEELLLESCRSREN